MASRKFATPVQEEKVLHLLRARQLSITEGRKCILQLFLDKEGALSHGDIEKKAGDSFDRVTIYRTLQTFVDKGLIHTIPSADNSIRYALCKDECADGHHRHHHVHFLCGICQQTFCLDEVATPTVKLPRGYMVDEIELLAKGICRSCSAKARS